MRHTIQQRWAGLTGRERLVVCVLGLFIVAALLLTLVIDPLLENLDLLDRQLEAKQRTLGQLALVGTDYARERAQLTEFDQRIMAAKGTFSLLSYLEEASAAAHVREQIAAMQPQATVSSEGYKETSAELRLAGVSFPSLLKLLAKLEESPYLLQIKRLQFKPRMDAPHRFDATLTVSAYDKEG